MSDYRYIGITFNYLNFDFNHGVKSTQICDKCTKENHLIELGDGYILELNESQGGICAVDGCHNKADHTIEFYVDEDKPCDN